MCVFACAWVSVSVSVPIPLSLWHSDRIYAKVQLKRIPMNEFFYFALINARDSIFISHAKMLTTFVVERCAYSWRPLPLFTPNMSHIIWPTKFHNYLMILRVVPVLLLFSVAQCVETFWAPSSMIASQCSSKQFIGQHIQYAYTLNMSHIFRSKHNTFHFQNTLLPKIVLKIIEAIIIIANRKSNRLIKRTTSISAFLMVIFNLFVHVSFSAVYLQHLW